MSGGGPAGSAADGPSSISLRGLFHLANQCAAFVMLEQHHANGSGLEPHALLFQQREQQLFLLAVVAAVGKESEEFEQAVKGFWRNTFSTIQPPGDLLGGIQHI